jgi:tetratricopeptide (TPR) repeat protein
MGSSLVNSFGWLLVLPVARLLKRHRLAEAWIEYRSRASGEAAFWQTCLADYYESVGLHPQAETSYRSAITLGATDGFPHAVFAGYLLKVERFREALDEYRTALELGTGLGDDYDRAIRLRVEDLEREAQRGPK